MTSKVRTASTALLDAGDLQAAMTGKVIRPQDDDYDAARAVWNADIDRRPEVIARCASAADVAAAVGWARRNGLEIAVRGGGHSMSGACSVEGGLVIDLSQLCAVHVDPATARARVGGGALLRDLDAATQEHGLAVPAGLISHTGVGGLTLGGGMGWLTRQAGLTIDNVLSAEVVLADGRIVRASERDHQDLFWALRGGGGNFGVVTEFEFSLQPVGPLVDFGMFFWPLDRGPDVLRFASELVPGLPRQVNAVVAALNAPPAPFVPAENQFQPGYALLLTGFGGSEQHNELADRVRAFSPPLFEVVGPMPYTAVQQLIDEPNAWGNFNYEKSTYLTELTEPAIAVISEHVARKTSPMSVTLIYRLDEAYCETSDDATAFGGRRTPRFSIFIVGVTADKASLDAERAWARTFYDALLPHTSGAGAYVNGYSDCDAVGLQAIYGQDKLQKLARIKAAYDPANVFHRNVNIAPAAVAGG